MSEFRLAPEAEAEVDEIWLHIARESGSVDIATGVVENITERFWLLARYPFLGRARDEDLRPGRKCTDFCVSSRSPLLFLPASRWRACP